MKTIVFSGDFLFGSDRRGNVPFLQKESSRLRFSLDEVEPVRVGLERVSSSAIRKKIARGEMPGAAWMLGRRYVIEGKVIRGFGRGLELGFPTINIQTENCLLPPGVFQTLTEIGGERYPSVTNIGTNPTFGGDELQVETYILGLKRSLYERRIALHFIEKIRDEICFSSTRELQEQISRDVAFVASRPAADS